MQLAGAEPVALGEAIGVEIDAAERDAYSLFPDLREFHSGRIVRDERGRYRLEWVTREGGGSKSREISAEAFELTRAHVGFVERHRALEAEDADAEVEARVLYRMAMRYSTEQRYDVVSSLLDELQTKHPALYETLGAAAFHAEAERLDGSQEPLYVAGSLVDRSGRPDIFIFAGYYGLWLGIAIPIALDASSPEEFALGPLLVPTASLVTAHVLTKERGISEPDARFIAVGGNFGAWQGLGWASWSGASTQAVFASGVLAGLAGIAVSGVAAGRVHVTEGHQAFTNAGMYWGAWFGLLEALAREATGEEVLRDMLVGSSALTLAGALGAEGTATSRKRVWLMNAGGFVGAVAGLGAILLADVSSDAGIAGTLGTGSVVGAAIAWGLSGPDHAEVDRPATGR